MEKRARRSAPEGRFFNVSPALIRLARDRRIARTDGEAAAKCGLSPARYSRLQAGKASPTVDELIKISRGYGVGLQDLFPPEQENLFVERTDTVAWMVRHGLSGHAAQQRDVAVAVLRGESPNEVALRLAPPPPHTGELTWEEQEAHEAALAQARRDVWWMVRGAFNLGLVQLVEPDPGTDGLDAELGKELSRGLSALRPDGVRTQALVVPNVAHPEFEPDPVAPFLVARAAHGVVRRFLAHHPKTFTIGVAGGLHVAAFVRSIGPENSPLPDVALSDRRFVFLPLTLEPFHHHAREPADPLVGALANRVSSMLGPERVGAPSFMPFGYLEERRVGDLEIDSIVALRDRYPRLDVAIFGCGDNHTGGWVEWMRKLLGPVDDLRAKTDVAMNLLDEDANLIPVPCPRPGGRRELLGIGLDDIRRLAAGGGKLALLLTSGPSKGLPITILARAACMTTLVCDQAAARAAIKVIRRSGAGASGGSAPKRSPKRSGRA